MSQSDVDLVRRAYDSFARGDVAGVMALMADDIEWNVPEVLPHGAHVRGLDGVGRFFGGLAERWSDFRLEITDVVEGETDGVVLGRGRAQGTLGGTPSGYGFVHAFAFRDGKAVRFDEYVAPPQGGFPAG